MGAGPRGTSAERLARHRSEQWWGHARYGVAQQAGQGAVGVPTPPNSSLDLSDSQNVWGAGTGALRTTTKKRIMPGLKRG